MPTNAFYAFAPALRGINSHAPHFYTDFHLLHSLQTALLTPFIHQMRPRAHLPPPAGLLLQPPVRDTLPIYAGAARTTCSRHSAHRCLWRGHCGLHCLWRGHCPRFAGHTQPASTPYLCSPLDCRVRRINAPLSQ